MNESTEQLLAKLEQATAPETPEPLGDETATLRESWLALGKLLDAADLESAQLPARPQRTRRAGLPPGFIAALAASLLVALAAWAILKRGSNLIEPKQEVAVPTELPAPALDITEVAEAPRADESDDAVDEFSWDDSFDEQLAATSQAIRSVQADWTGGDRRYSVLLDQFEQFDAELSEGSL